ncbi:hypothetical protein CQA49_00015 [Helicobacter sp. MIT 00-7814]|uniref:hypothetical protein n=1 Tax=unclassified Helicobacter TaxID=2593540 RepID=UPI000E1F85EB|nr:MULTISPECIES: hypothetical protein [unclassified Helicobacter]RDU57089.1 hypothetical protein CQA49_00015 [Helicobacter sp. MIT 00-7814]RDU57640.1 hypothetical protein CQA37_00015 [Helicobacter sp. MIT 99-10781]
MQIKTPDDLVKIHNLNGELKTKVNQYFNAYKNDFLMPCNAYLHAIKQQLQNILNNELEHPKGTFYVKTDTLKITYKKEPFEIIDINFKKR